MKVYVALLTEGVDRNLGIGVDHNLALPVALLAEGVDRNFAVCVKTFWSFLSPSSRRAWIEIFDALLVCLVVSRRPPRGGRG